MKKNTVLYAVTCMRHASGFDQVEEAEKDLFAVVYGDKVGLPVVRRKGTEFVDPATLLGHMADVHGLNLYAPSVRVRIPSMCTESQQVYAHLSTARPMPPAQRIARARGLKSKRDVFTQQAPETAASPTVCDEARWTKESLLLMSQLPLKINGIPEYIQQAKAQTQSASSEAVKEVHVQETGRDVLADEVQAKIQALGISPALMGSDPSYSTVAHAHSQPEAAT